MALRAALPLILFTFTQHTYVILFYFWSKPSGIRVSFRALRLILSALEDPDITK